jgi:two-component system, cell cycle response regulator DivK
MAGRILIAEDYADNRELLKLMLEMHGFTIYEASDGHECLSIAREHIPDLAMIDLSMPEKDGWDVIKEIRADERTSAIKCIAFTAFTADLYRQRALKEGFDAYLTKPFKSKELIEIVQQLLTKKE